MGAIDREDAVVQRPVDIGVRDGRRIERVADGLERAIGAGNEFAFGEHGAR